MISERLGIIGAIVVKDLRTFARDRFYAFVSVLGLVFYIVIFWVLPGSVDETIALGVHLDAPSPVLDAVAGSMDGAGAETVDGLELVGFDTSEALEAAVREDGDLVAGLDFPDDFVEAVRAGESPTVRVFLQAEAPDEIGTALAGLVRELGFLLAGQEPPVTPPDLDEVVLGVDRAGDQVSLRERMRPLFVFFVLLVEMLALATLVAAEMSQRTITALLVTPARVSDVLAAKAVLGTLLAFTQAMVLVIALGSFLAAPVLLTLTLLLGGVLVTGFGLLAGSAGRDFIGVMFISLVFLIPLAVPAIDALFPGTAAGWVRALPTYGLVQVIVGTTAYGEGWADALPHLGSLLAWCVIAFVVGVAVLTRRVARV